METRAIVLAAGKGTRLNTDGKDTSKVMHTICGKPLLEVVLGLIDFIPQNDTYIVVGYKKEEIISYFGNGYNYVEQKEQKGTGHAVAVCTDAFDGYEGDVIVLFGDMPMYHKEVLEDICKYHKQNKNDCTIMVAYNDELPDWGRVVRDKNGKFVGIIEARDCNAEQAKTKELFSGVFVFNSKSLFTVLPQLSDQNAQNEYYLTEVPKLMMQRDMKIDLYTIEDGDDIRGVNTPQDLAVCEAIMKKRNGQ